MTPAIPPTPRTWTLRCKHHTTTILLHVDPLQPLALVRAELLHAVTQTSPSGKFNYHVIPTSERDILLARPIDAADLAAGWESLEKEEELHTALEEEQDGGRGKGKAGAKGKARLSDCPQGAGLRDGGVVAFKFRSEAEDVRRAAAERQEEEDEGIELEEDERLDGETLVGEQVERWDVVVPSMAETYGDDEEEDEGDEGKGEGGRTPRQSDHRR